MEKEIKQEFDNLGRMVKSGFDETNKKIDDLDRATDERLLEMQSEMRHGFNRVDARLGSIERDIAELRKHFVYRDEFEDLMGRVKYLEQKLGIESGK